MKHTIACRPGCYDLPLPEALKELKRAGVNNAEINAPADGDYAALAKYAADAGVQITTLSSDTQLDDAEQVARLERAIAGAKSLGVSVIFLAAALKSASYEQGVEILKGLAAKAAQAGVTLSLETHPPFAANAVLAQKTVEAVNSKGLGYNYDTANIYYYNAKGIDTVSELKKALPYIRSVHLKESAKGEPFTFDFPVFGAGIVDFAEVFRVLDAHGYTGPYTMELEGPLVDGQPTQERTAKIKACLDYLKKIGAAD